GHEVILASAGRSARDDGILQSLPGPCGAPGASPCRTAGVLLRTTRACRRSQRTSRRHDIVALLWYKEPAIWHIHPPTEGKTPMSGKFEIIKAKNGKFMFNLKASNGEIILTSQMYEAKTSAQQGIDSVKANAPQDDRYE